jgi:hypothetical protein
MKRLSANDQKKSSSIWLWGVLAITIGLTIWTAMDGKNTHQEEVVEMTERTHVNTLKPLQERAEAISSIEMNSTETTIWQGLKREVKPINPKNLFNVHAWVAPVPVAKIKPVALPAPVAPPAPFVYVGKLEDSPSGNMIILMANDKVFTVAKNAQIDAFWRLDGDDAETVKLTFLPLNLPQILSKNQQAITATLANKLLVTN